ncbi:hypothetical protein ACFSTC_02530 [Nonomuraea ferruginea]
MVGFAVFAGKTGKATLTGPRILAVAIAVVAPLLEIAALVQWAGLPEAWTPQLTVTPQSAVVLTFPAVGAYLIAHRPRLNMAWMMCAGGLAAGLSDFFQSLMLRVAADGHLMLAGYLRHTYIVFWAVCGLTLTALLPLYSPDGRLPSPRWRWALALSAVSLGTEMLRNITRPDPSPIGYRFPEVVPNPLQIRALAPYQEIISETAWAKHLPLAGAGRPVDGAAAAPGRPGGLAADRVAALRVHRIHRLPGRRDGRARPGVGGGAVVRAHPGRGRVLGHALPAVRDRHRHQPHLRGRRAARRHQRGLLRRSAPWPAWASPGTTGSPGWRPPCSPGRSSSRCVACCSGPSTRCSTARSATPGCWPPGSPRRSGAATRPRR